MTTIDINTPSILPPLALVPVVHDLYRDIHKGIRAELFAVTAEAGRLDPADRLDRAALATHVVDVVSLLVSHAQHEDGAVQPVLVTELPALAERVEYEHQALEAWMERLEAMATDAATAADGDARHPIHQTYLELGAFTSAYLAHQDIEERVIMPALAAAVGPEAVMAIQGAIISAIPPQEMATSLALMLPAMNVDNRTELLGGMQANAPAEVFAGVWGLAGSVLDPGDHAAVAARLGL